MDAAGDARPVAVRPWLAGLERAWAVAVLDRALGGPLQARRGELVDVLAGPALVAEVDGRSAGLLTYSLRLDGCELSSLVSLVEGRGVGRALVEALIGIATDARAERIWVVTTNDNLNALGFYQHLGFRLVALRAGGVTEARTTLKPSIARYGANDLPIRDELELELPLTKR